MRPVLLCVVACTMLVGCRPEPIYTVVAPSKLRPNSDYHVSIRLDHGSEPALFELTVSGPSTSSEFNRVGNTVTVRPGETRILNLEIGQWSRGNYKLVLAGKPDPAGPVEWKNETSLEYEPRAYSIFVQTDKAVYKPAELVRLRAVVVNPSLVPSLAGAVDVYVRDPHQNLIKQWKRVVPQRGVVTLEMPLSEQPPLGDWTIAVEAAGQTAQKRFAVAEYVLPTFSVEVSLPAYATYNNSEVVATVRASYTYGKPVRGQVTLTVQPHVRYPSIATRPLEQYQVTVPLADDGAAHIPVNVVRDLNIKTDFFEREIEFFALVRETLTGRQYNGTGLLKIYHKEIKVEMLKSSHTFKPGLPYRVLLRVAYQDDTPVEEAGPPLRLRYGYSYDAEQWNQTVESVPQYGLFHTIIDTPRQLPDGQPPTVLGLRAEYRGQTYYMESVRSAQSPSNTFLQLSPRHHNLTDLLAGRPATAVGQELTFDLNGTETLGSLAYQVMAKGDIVLARTVPSPGAAETSITIPITHRMTPKARLLVYYVREPNQEIVADAVTFQVDGTFKTPVRLTTSLNETKPGGTVEIRVETKPGAYVALLGVDQSVLLLRSGFDITQADVLRELDAYDGGGGAGGEKRHWRSRRFGRGFPGGLWSDSATAGELFDDAGVVVLTNGHLHRHFNSRLGKRIFYTNDGDGIIVPRVPRPEAPRMLASIRLDDTILEEGLQPPNFKLSERSETRRIVLRKTFPETWIWTDITTGTDGVARHSDTVPDTITSWYVSAFAVDSVTGLGVAPEPAQIRVFRPFFIKLSLPYSILRGESVSLQAIVFNYQSKPVQAEVTMQNLNDEFEFTNAANEIEFGGESNVREKRKTVTIAPFDGVSVPFLITPKKLGHIGIRVMARTDNAGDAIVRKLLVKPEGQTQYFNKPMLVNVPAAGGPLLKRNFSVVVPENAVPGSVRVTVSGISDILGPTVNHLDDLLRMPYGCGEQNMINLVPNIVVSNYLVRVNRMTEAIRSKAKRHIETGYQRELTYRRDDGSFSAFGNQDKAGSTWLTAFVVKTFVQARPHIDVDPAVLTKATDWLLSRQRKDGSFAEYGEVHHKALQGGAAIRPVRSGSESTESDTAADDGSGGPLTAFVLIALLQEPKRDELAVQRAADYLYSRVSASTNPYEVAIASYALHLAESPHRDVAYKKLMAMVQRPADGHQHMYWTIRPENQQQQPETAASDYLVKPNAVDVEATAYALLTMVHRSEVEPALPALHWLISKQNSNGGFSSTQDTVIALQALGAIAERISSATVRLAVTVRHGNGRSDQPEQPVPQSFHFNPDNALVLQQIELNPDTRWVALEATGFGTAVLQVSYQYNLAVSAEKPAFFLNPQKDKTSTDNYLQLSVCTYYKDGNATNMAVMEVELPSGYAADVDALSAATRAKEVKRVETSNEHGMVTIYLDRVTRDELCVTVPAHRSHHVANNKPVPVTIYDYYDRSKLSRIFYEPNLVTFCDICPAHETDCKARCTPSQRLRQSSSSRRAEGSRSLDPAVTGHCSAFSRQSAWLLSLLATLIHLVINHCQ